MIIQTMRCYLLYCTPVTERLLTADGQRAIGVTPALVERFKQHFQVQPAPVPAFYTSHYRTEHTPYLVSDPAIPPQTRIPAEKLQALDFFKDLGLTRDLRLHWEFTLSMQTTGLITLCVETDETVPAETAYHLSGLYLNPDYAVVDTEPILGLWQSDPAARPAFIALDELAQVIRRYFLSQCGLPARPLRTLRHEMQIPFTAIEVDTDAPSDEEFVEWQAQELAEFVFKPACWEVEHVSAAHAQHVLNDSRVWNVAQDTYVVTAYEGTLYVKLKPFDTGTKHEVSGFHLTEEASVLHSFKLAVSDYHFVRILDNLLDAEIARISNEVVRYQKMLHALFHDRSLVEPSALSEMNEFVVEATNLQFGLLDVLEELDNPDKLIDEEWHIVLLDKFTAALGTKTWRDSIRDRVTNMRELVQTVEDIYERYLNMNVNASIAQFNTQMLRMNQESQRMGDRLKWVSYIFSVLAVAELLGLLIEVGWNDDNALVQHMVEWWTVSLDAAHGLAVLGVVLVIALLFAGIIWWEKRSSRP